jgi:hypothetical protein
MLLTSQKLNGANTAMVSICLDRTIAGRPAPSVRCRTTPQLISRTRFVTRPGRFVAPVLRDASPRRGLSIGVAHPASHCASVCTFLRRYRLLHMRTQRSCDTRRIASMYDNAQTSILATRENRTAVLIVLTDRLVPAGSWRSVWPPRSSCSGFEYPFPQRSTRPTPRAPSPGRRAGFRPVGAFRILRSWSNPMEHRWGRRVECPISVVIEAGAHARVRAKIRNLSLSGPTSRLK